MKSILVVDDDEQFRASLCEILSDLYEVSDVCNGKLAMDLLAKDKHFDVIVTDIFMPEKEGIEIIHELKLNYPSTHIIAMSGGGNMCAAETLYFDPLKISEQLGAERILRKPFRIKDMICCIEQISS